MQARNVGSKSPGSMAGGERVSKLGDQRGSKMGGERGSKMGAERYYVKQRLAGCQQRLVGCQCLVRFWKLAR